LCAARVNLFPKKERKRSGEREAPPLLEYGTGGGMVRGRGKLFVVGESLGKKVAEHKKGANERG